MRPFWRQNACSAAPPRQFEYWAELDKAIDGVLDPDDLLAINEGLAQLKIAPPTSAAVESDGVFEDSQAARKDRSLSSAVASTRFINQASTDQPELLERINSDGARVTDRFNKDEFESVRS